MTSCGYPLQSGSEDVATIAQMMRRENLNPLDPGGSLSRSMSGQLGKLFEATTNCRLLCNMLWFQGGV